MQEVDFPINFNTVAVMSQDRPIEGDFQQLLIDEEMLVFRQQVII